MQASQWRGSFFGFGSCTGSRYRGYSHCLSDQGSEYGCVSTSSMEMDGQNWPSLTEARQGGRCNNFSCSCTVTLDTLSERNRGPRAFKPKVRTTAYGFAVDNSKNGTLDDILKGSYNQLDFVTNYKVAKFFIIKSYSEDNVHKSIQLWSLGKHLEWQQKVGCCLSRSKGETWDLPDLSVVFGTSARLMLQTLSTW